MPSTNEPTSALASRIVVVTREKGYNEDVRAWLGIDSPVEIPLTVTDFEELGVVSEQLHRRTPVEKFATVVVTSPRVRDYLPLAIPYLQPDADVATVGAASTAAAAAAGLRGTMTSDRGAEGLVAQIRKGPVLSLGARFTRPELASGLRRRAFEHEHLVCYTTRPCALNAEQQAGLHRAEVLIIGAPSAWDVAAPFVSPTTVVVVPGLTTARAVQRDHARVVEAWGPTMGVAVANFFHRSSST